MLKARRSVRWPMLLALAGTSLGCRDLPPFPFTSADAGPLPPIDAAVRDTLVTRYANVVARHATERCRCAIDFEYCRDALDANLSASELVCVGEAVQSNAVAFEQGVSCLEAAALTFESCHGDLACADTTSRMQCADFWQADGNVCFELFGSAIVAKLLSCTSAVDAGS